MSGRRSPFWTMPEIAIIREVYPNGGVEACMERLPRRTRSGIQQQAAKLRVLAPAANRKVFRWRSSEFIDAAICRYYQGAPRRNGVRELAERLGRPKWWVSKRARDLGLMDVRFKEPDWSEAELELLGEHFHKNPDVVVKIFAKHGFTRTGTAIAIKRKRSGYRMEDAPVYSARGLARAMGVDVKTITRWISLGLLRAKHRGTRRCEAQGGDMYEIKPIAVRDFLINHTAHFDHRKADKFWLVDVLTARSADARVA